MAASYPAAIKNFSAVVNGVTKLVAALFNSPYDEITAIETELGTDVAGTVSDLKTRLAVAINNDGTLKTDVDDYGISASVSTAKTLENVKICYGTITINSSTSQAITNLPFTDATSYVVTVSPQENGGANFQYETVRNSGAQFTITNAAGVQVILNWIAIGT